MTKNFRFGARFPIGWNGPLKEKIYEQFRAAHAYQCVLIEIERKRRNAVEDLYRSTLPDKWAAFDKARTESLAAVDRVRMSRSTDGKTLDDETKNKHSAENKLAREHLTECRQREKSAYQEWKKARKEITPSLIDSLKALDREAKAETKTVYGRGSDIGLLWGTRGKIAQAMELAAKSSAKRGTLPHFPRFSGGGMIAVQIQKGMTETKAFSQSDTRFRLEKVEFDKWLNKQGKRRFDERGEPIKNILKKDSTFPKRSVQRNKRGKSTKWLLKKDGSLTSKYIYALAHLRIGSNQDRTPIWAAWPVVLHRPLPENAKIKWAQVTMKKIGLRPEWSLVLSVDMDLPKRKILQSTLAVNFGWRNLSSGKIRVAYAVGSDGYQEEILVPERFVSCIDHSNQLGKIRKDIFNLVIADLVSWKKENDYPEWFASKTAKVEDWLASKRLFYLLQYWERNRFPGDEDIFPRLMEWKRRKGRHLWFWEADEREKALRMRQDYYRCIAKRWSNVYDRVITVDMDLRDFAEKDSPEANDEDDKKQRVTQRLAAPSIFREAVKQAFISSGGIYETAKAPYTTQICYACGDIHPFDARRQLVRTCKCGVTWDQDENHCRNLLDDLAGDPERKIETFVAEKKTSRWSKRKNKEPVSSESTTPGLAPEKNPENPEDVPDEDFPEEQVA